MQVIAIANHKGGVGKTTTTLNLGCALAERGMRVLLVDLDPQANTTEGLGLEQHTPRLEDLLVDGDHDAWSWLPAGAAHFGHVLRAREDGTSEAQLRIADLVWVLPTSMALVQAQDAIVATGPQYPLRLRDLLQASRDQFDVVLIDTPAVGATMWTNLGLLAAQWVIAPAAPADYDIRAATKQARFISDYMVRANPDLRMLGVLITMADLRWRLVAAAARLLDRAGLERIPVAIPMDNRGRGVKASLRRRAPLFLTEPDGRVSEAYRAVAKHVLTKIGEGVPSAA